MFWMPDQVRHDEFGLFTISSSLSDEWILGGSDHQGRDSDMNEIHEQKFIDIAILDNIIEAQLIQSILNEQNIPHLVHSFHDTAYDGLFQVQMGWGKLCAPLSYKKEILEILNDVRSINFDNQE